MHTNYVNDEKWSNGMRKVIALIKIAKELLTPFAHSQTAIRFNLFSKNVDFSPFKH